MRAAKATNTSKDRSFKGKTLSPAELPTTSQIKSFKQTWKI